MGLQLAFFVHIERSRLNIYWSEKCFLRKFQEKIEPNGSSIICSVESYGLSDN